MFLYKWFRLLFSQFLGLFGLVLSKERYFASSIANRKIAAAITILGNGSGTSHLPLDRILRLISASKSQLGQDLLALSLSSKDDGGKFFVEFGATDGVTLSNTYLLETEFNWSGILVEPARSWHGDLKVNRNVTIDTRCVYSQSGTSVEFYETRMKEYSTISDFSKVDEHSFIRVLPKKYKVETVSLLDLLLQCDAPSHIDFISIDTEGSEFEILRDFDFGRFSFGLVCVEHNFGDTRIELFDLFSGNGYRQIYPELSDFDDWYVGPNH